MELRKTIDELISNSQAAEAVRLLAEYWRQEKSSARAGFVIARFERLRPHLELRPYRIAFLRSFTVEPLIPMVRAEAFVLGLEARIFIGEFNAYAQELLSVDSGLYSFNPEVVFLCVQTRDIAPEIWTRFADLTPEEDNLARERVLSGYASWIRAFRQQSSAHVVIHNLELPAVPAAGIFDAQGGSSQTRALLAVNGGLVDLARQYRGVFILDYDGLVARKGRENWHDARKWLTARLPIQAQYLKDLMAEWFRYLHPLTGKISKAVVFDLDNTIWGGVIGEDGPQGIQLGIDHPGAAYQNVQRALVDLHRRGILLAVCSKNNPDDAWAAFDRHPAMLIRREHLAAWRINWNAKSDNLLEIAKELNIGADALAFVDDNPVERQQVGAGLPEVAIVDLPSDPAGYASTLRAFPWFERLTLSAEDRQRGEMYAQQRQRADLEQTAGSREDFYRSLEQVAKVSPVGPDTIARVAQLTQKTNQFNLTTQRYTEQQIEDLSRLPTAAVYFIEVRDRFADNGIVGAAITNESSNTLTIDSFLLSCRVISRTVETAFLSHLVEQAKQRGLSVVQGWFHPTKKNSPCRDFYRDHHFKPISENAAGGVLWELKLSAGETVECPEWIELVAHREAGG